MGNRYKIKISLVVFLLLTLIRLNDLIGQEPHFTMFQHAPVFLNSANTGVFTGDWRLAGNYRSQWWVIDDAIRTATFSYDKKIYLLNHTLGGGVLVVHDQTGTNGLKYNKIYASGGYNTIYSNHFLSGGLQVGYVNASLSGDQTLPGDWDPQQGEFNSEVARSGEKLSYLDVNVGLLWKRNIKNFEPTAGLTFSHVNMPKQSFLATNERMAMRTAVHISVLTRFKDYYIDPVLYYSSQKSATDMIFGLNGGMYIKGNMAGIKSLHGGLFLRNGLTSNIDAFAVYAGATVGRIDVRINYDINISGLSVVTGNRGAFEISFIYKSISTVLNSYSIPCNRL